MKKKYDTSSARTKIFIMVDRVEWLKLKAIGQIKGLDKSQVSDLAFKEFNEKNKGIL